MAERGVSIQPDEVGLSAVRVACAAVAVACGGHAAAGALTATAASAHARVAAGDWLSSTTTRSAAASVHPTPGSPRANLGQLHAPDGADRRDRRLVGDRAAAASTSTGRVRDLIVVTTTYGKTIAIDPATGAELWEYMPRVDNGPPPAARSSRPRRRSIDPDRRYVYAASPDGYIHKLVVATGHEVRSVAGRHG